MSPVSAPRAVTLGEAVSGVAQMGPGGVDSRTHQARPGVAVVIELFELIHPHFSCTNAVGQGLAAGVGRLLGENVANVGTRVYFQSPTTLPDLCTAEERREQ